MEGNKQKYSNEKVIFGTGPANTSLVNEYRRPLLHYIDQIKKLGNGKLKIIDVGCGSGSIVKALKNYFPIHEFWGCDISQAAIKKARQKSGGVKFFVSDAEKLEVKSASFDVVIMHSVLDHIQRPLAAAKEVHRILKKGGTFLFMDPLEKEPSTIHGQLTRFKWFRNHRRNRCGHIHAFSEKSLTKLVEQSGFQIKNVTRDWLYLAQMVDVFYYPLLSLSGKGPEFTLKRISQGKSYISRAVLILKKMFTAILNMESYFADHIALGFLAYVKAEKK